MQSNRELLDSRLIKVLPARHNHPYHHNEVHMAKVILYLRNQEFLALGELAQREYRAPRAQAALIIRRELEKLGMITLEEQELCTAGAMESQRARS